MMSSSPRYSPYCTSISCIILLPVFDKRCFSRSGMWIHSFSLTTWDFEPNVTVATPSTTIHRSDRYLWYCRDVLCPGFTVSRLTLNCFPSSRIVNDPQGRNSVFTDEIDFGIFTLRACQFPEWATDLKINLFKTFSCDWTKQTNNSVSRQKWFLKNLEFSTSLCILRFYFESPRTSTSFKDDCTFVMTIAWWMHSL